MLPWLVDAVLVLVNNIVIYNSKEVPLRIGAR
jgi:hypothetical protein